MFQSRNSAFGGKNEKGKEGERGERRERRGRGRDGAHADAIDKDMHQETVDLARVTRVTKGGKRMRFRACVVVGDKKGGVGFGVAKGADVTIAMNKAARQAKKHMLKVILEKSITIPHAVKAKHKAARVLLKPAPAGSGIIAGGAVRLVLQAAGIPNIVSKCLGSKNKINNIKATFDALRKLKPRKS
jgi:small subunit ribosomal protein S5